MNRLILFLVVCFFLRTGIHAQNAVLEQTVIDSDRVELVGEADRNVFRFLGNVTITGTNLKARCDEMELISARKEDTAGSQSEEEGLIGQIGGIQSLIAKGNVFIEQAGRTVQGGIAKIYPQEGYLEVSENPRFTDTTGAIVTGKTIKLERGNRRAIVESEQSEDGTGKRATVVLPPIQDLGVDLDKLIEGDAVDSDERENDDE